MRGPVDVHRHGALTLVLGAGACGEALGGGGDLGQASDADHLALGGEESQAQTTVPGAALRPPPAPRSLFRVVVGAAQVALRVRPPAA